MLLQAAMCHKTNSSNLYIHGNHVSDSIKNEGIPMSTTYNLFDNHGTFKQEVMQRPQWLDEQLYPFQSHFVEIDGNRIHLYRRGKRPHRVLPPSRHRLVFLLSKYNQRSAHYFPPYNT